LTAQSVDAENGHVAESSAADFRLGVLPDLGVALGGVVILVALLRDSPYKVPARGLGATVAASST
ncbi:MAG: hypothetical protein Q8S13_04955, partial [Dehalococcoidia bacterium]|nr:hypothetical protein [Dehalococcoidia bacterium]